MLKALARLLLLAALPVLTTGGASRFAAAAEPALGFTAPSTEIEVSTALRDLVTEVAVREGDVVAKGDLLVVLDTAALEAELAIAKARAEASGALRRAEAVLAAKQTQYDLMAKLRKQGAARAEELSFAESELAVAQAELQGAADQQVIARLEVARLETALDQRLVRAPADGVIAEIFRDPGELVGAQETRLMTLAVLDPLQVEVYVATAQGRALAQGATATIELPLAGVSVVGSVVDVAVKADAASGTMRVRLQFDNPGLALRSGERALVTFALAATE
jgi:RND family efflux transporter MFP subunit